MKNLMFTHNLGLNIKTSGRLGSFSLLQLMLATFLLGIMSLSGAALAAEESISGTIHVIWGDPPPGSGLPPMQLFILTDDQGKSIPLAINENLIKSLGGIRGINRKRVTVKGQWAVKPQTPAESGETGVFEVQSIKIEQPSKDGRPAPVEGVSALTGSQPWVTILCRFSDKATTPHPTSWFDTLMGNANPGMNHYWQELSYNNINLNGSTVVGWYDLPNTQASYVPSGSANLSLLATDCATAADADVNFPSFMGINFMFNYSIGCCAWGGTRYLTFDGQFKTYSTTWMPPWGYGAHGILAQEMGHGFGLMHSSGPYNTPYDSDWDPLSSATACRTTNHPDYGCIGVHTISYHKDSLGWITSPQKYVAASGTIDQSIILERLGQPTNSTDYRMAQIPISDSSTQFYTVEARRTTGGYDTNIPGNAIIIHKVDTTLGDRNAQVVDDTNNSDPNDAGAMWTVGETFTDMINGISVTINSDTGTGYSVTINNSSPSFSYSYDDQIPYSWIDATVGTNTGIAGIDSYANILIGFDFDFYSNTHNTANVSSNGFLTFGTSGRTAYINASIPSASSPDDLISPFWDDLNPSAGGAVYYLIQGTAPNRTLTIEWYNIPHYSKIGAATFEATLYEGSGNIRFQYMDVDFGNINYNSGASATVGIENADGTNGLQYSYNQSVISNSMAILFSRDSGAGAAVTPTLSEWGMILLSILLLSYGIWVLGKRGKFFNDSQEILFGQQPVN